MDTFEHDLRWTREHLRVTRATADALPDLAGMRLACSMHLEIKMVPAIEGLLRRGAKVFLTTCNPQTVSDDVVGYCVAQGAEAAAARGMSRAASADAVQRALAWGPTHLCEMGADLTAALVHAGGASSVRAGLEATGSGTARLAGLAVPYPVFNWDDLPIKEGLHNRHMVGLVTCHAFFDRTRLTFHGKRVVVVGYGLVGRGTCDAARAYGGRVCVVERDAGRALEAAFAGWEVVTTLEAALPTADVVITATGAAGVLAEPHFGLLRDGAFLLNVGHAADEIDVRALYAHPHALVRPYVERVALGARGVYLFAGGSMANLTAGFGDSLNAFDVTLGVMLAGVGFLAGDGARHAAGVHLLPAAVWRPVAQLALPHAG